MPADMPVILGADGRPVRAVGTAAHGRRQVRARFDAAQTTDENAKHWSWADALSADTAANPAVRQKLRNRSRYEVANNSYARGIVNFIANDTIGRSIRLLMRSDPAASQARNRRALTAAEASFIEGEFLAWLEEIGGPEKLRTMRAARCVDGEGFSQAFTNPLLESPVKLDQMLFEAEMCQDEMAALPERNRVDGIRFDPYGNPQAYRVLEEHPGGGWWGSWGHGEWIDASRICHLYNPERPGQRRGIPQLTPALPLFAQARRFTLAVIAAAETAADFAAIMYAPVGAEEGPVPTTPFDLVEIERRMMSVLPEGWDMRQFKAEQPVATHAEFMRVIMREINRCLETPFSVALGDASEYNYASAKIETQVWQKTRGVDRGRITHQVLDRWFRQWRKEAILIEGYLPQAARMDNTDWSHEFLFDGEEHQDPQREANGQSIRLKNLTTTLAEEWAKKGKDYEEQIRQIGRERRLLAEEGLSLDDVKAEDDPEDLAFERDTAGNLVGIQRAARR